MSVTKITVKTIELDPGQELVLKHGEKLLEQKIIIERVDEGFIGRIFKRVSYQPNYKAVCLLQCFEYDDEGKQT